MRKAFIESVVHYTNAQKLYKNNDFWYSFFPVDFESLLKTEI